MARFFVTLLAGAAIMLQGVSAYPYYPFPNGTIPYPAPTGTGSPVPTGTGAPSPTGTGAIYTPPVFQEPPVHRERHLREVRIDLHRN